MQEGDGAVGVLEARRVGCGVGLSGEVGELGVVWVLRVLGMLGMGVLGVLSMLGVLGMLGVLRLLGTLSSMVGMLWVLSMVQVLSVLSVLLGMLWVLSMHGAIAVDVGLGGDGWVSLVVIRGVAMEERGGKMVVAGLGSDKTKVVDGHVVVLGFATGRVVVVVFQCRREGIKWGSLKRIRL